MQLPLATGRRSVSMALPRRPPSEKPIGRSATPTLGLFNKRLSVGCVAARHARSLCATRKRYFVGQCPSERGSKSWQVSVRRAASAAVQAGWRFRSMGAAANRAARAHQQHRTERRRLEAVQRDQQGAALQVSSRGVEHGVHARREASKQGRLSARQASSEGGCDGKLPGGVGG